MKALHSLPLPLQQLQGEACSPVLALPLHLKSGGSPGGEGTLPA